MPANPTRLNVVASMLLRSDFDLQKYFGLWSAAFFLPAGPAANIDVYVTALSGIDADTAIVILGQPAIGGPFVVDFEIHSLTACMF